MFYVLLPCGSMRTQKCDFRNDKRLFCITKKKRKKQLSPYERIVNFIEMDGQTNFNVEISLFVRLVKYEPKSLRLNSSILWNKYSSYLNCVDLSNSHTCLRIIFYYSHSRAKQH